MVYINNPDIDEMCGFNFVYAPQGKYAKEMLEIIKKFASIDKSFKIRIENHYKAFKQVVNKK